MSDDSLSDETSKLRLEISQTEDELMIAKTNAGIISVADTEKSYSEGTGDASTTELMEARASLAEHQMSLDSLAVAETKGGITNLTLNVPTDAVDHYKSRYLRPAELPAEAPG